MSARSRVGNPLHSTPDLVDRAVKVLRDPALSPAPADVSAALGTLLDALNTARRTQSGPPHGYAHVRDLAVAVLAGATDQPAAPPKVA